MQNIEAQNRNDIWADEGVTKSKLNNIYVKTKMIKLMSSCLQVLFCAIT